MLGCLPGTKETLARSSRESYITITALWSALNAILLFYFVPSWIKTISRKRRAGAPALLQDRGADYRSNTWPLSRADRRISAFGGNSSVEGMNLNSRLTTLKSKRTYLVLLVLLALMWYLLFLLYRIRRKKLDITGRPSDRQSWSLGQIVALATWIPVVVEFLYICTCKSMLMIPFHDLSLA